MAQQADGPGIGPVRVVDHQHDRSASAGCDEQSDHSVEEEETFGVGVHRGDRRNVGDPFVEFGGEAAENAAMTPDVVDEEFLLGVADEK